MLGVALLDDHPAVLAGLRRLIEPQPDMTVIAAAATAPELARRLDGRGTDVLVLDYDLAGRDGLSLCQHIKRRPHPPAVVIYSAYAGDALALAARAAGADGIVDKSDPVERLLTAIRGAATGELVMPALPQDAYQFAAAALDDEDLPVLALLLDRTPIDAIANALRISETQASWQAQRIVGRLRPGLTARFEDHATRAARRARSGRS
jgi:DNA-binding NarL/FixJ family response regulator